MTTTSHHPPLAGQPPAAPPPSVPRRTPPQTWLTLGLAVLAVAGVALGATATVIALNKPSAPPPAAAPVPPAYTPEQVGAAKAKACTTEDRLITGVLIADARSGPKALDDALGWANAANGRLAMLAAATYLPTQVDAATPQDLKDALGILSSSAGTALAISIKEEKTDDYAKAITTFNVASDEVKRLCNG